MRKYNITCPCIARLFVIIPKSCTYVGPGTIFEREEHIGPMDPVVEGFRKYHLQLYKVTLKDGRVRVLGNSFLYTIRSVSMRHSQKL